MTPTKTLPMGLSPLVSIPMVHTYTGGHGHHGMGMGDMGMGDMGMDGMGGMGMDHMAGAPMDIAAATIPSRYNVTVTLSFSVDFLPGEQAIFARDLRGDGLGDLQVFLDNGTLVVELEDGDGKREWLTVPDLVVSPETTYHLGVSLGGDGLQVWLDGRLVAAEPQAKSGWHDTDRDLTIGGSRGSRNEPDDDPHSLFEGEIGNFYIFGGQLGQAQITALARHADKSLGMKGAMAEAMDDLLPGWTQLHHGSESARMMAMEYGIMPMPMRQHGDVPMVALMREVDMTSGTSGRDKLRGTKADDALDGKQGHDRIAGRKGDDIAQGGTGNDRINGGAGNDLIDGGEGEDILRGGGGNDLLLSRSDAREPYIAYVPDRDEGDPENELTNGKLYPDQPVHADDRLYGGKGADIFYFQTLINGKERYLEKHTNDNGVINWHGVAGENDRLHDHWVDHIGYDAVMDFSRAEGDKIIIEGHTTKIYEIRYGDGNGDGVMDRSEIVLYSDQGGGGGAHHMDQLGSVMVYGDLVLRSDIETTAAPAYGIVEHIADLDDAIAPPVKPVDLGPIKAPRKTLEKLAENAPGPVNGQGPILAIPGAQTFDAAYRDAMVFRHTDAMALRSGTISLTVNQAEATWTGLLSKDARDMEDPGHLSVFIEDDGDLVMRLQDGEKNHWLNAEGAITPGTEHSVAVSWGTQGAMLWVDGVRVAYNSDVTQGLQANPEALVIGASSQSATPGTTDKLHGHFSGEIGSVALYPGQLTAAQLGQGGGAGTLDVKGSSAVYAIREKNGDLILKGRGETVKVGDDVTFIAFSDRAVRPEDIQFGTGKDDTLEGGTGSDVLLGRNGEDRLSGRGNDDHLDGGAGDDSLWGGGGRDLLMGGEGDDRIDGNEDADSLRGGAGDDALVGGAGSDRFHGGFGDDDIFGFSWGEAGKETDTVVYDGNFSDYSFDVETFTIGSRDAPEVTRLVVTDTPSGGTDGFYEGSDRLVDIERLVFSDQTVLVADVI